MSDRAARFLTAECLLGQLEESGLARGTVAERLGISKATLYQWPGFEAGSSPVGAPTDEQLGALVMIAIKRLRTQHETFIRFLNRDDVRARERRDLLHGMLTSVDELQAVLKSLDDEWQNMEAELQKFVERFGRKALDLISVGGTSHGSATANSPELAGDKAAAITEEAKVEVPRELERANFTHKYEAVFAVLMRAGIGAHPSDLSAQVRSIFPRGTFLPYRICEDIGHLLRADGVYADIGSRLTAAQRRHLEAMKANMQERGWWGRR